MSNTTECAGCGVDVPEDENQPEGALCDDCNQFLVDLYTDTFEIDERREKVRKSIEQADPNQPQVSGFVIRHTRSSDTVYFGPFPTLEALQKWMDEIGIPNGVSGGVIPLINPLVSPEHFWWIPSDTPWSDLLLPVSERTDL